MSFFYEENWNVEGQKKDRRSQLEFYKSCVAVHWS